MTTTNMFLNFGGKWDSPPLKDPSFSGLFLTRNYYLNNHNDTIYTNSVAEVQQRSLNVFDQ